VGARGSLPYNTRVVRKPDGPEQVGKYELVRQIGEGGMAEVHLAVRRGEAGVEKLVVIKLIHAHLAKQKPFVDRLLDEGRLAGMIKHPNVVEVHDLGELDGRYFVAMEYLEGEPLLAVLRAGGEGERLDPMSTARVIANTAEGLEAAHRLKSRDGKPLGLVHHDVSLGNIVVLYSGGVKLVDFGVAKARSADGRDQVSGKVAYMAPEKLTEGAEIDRRSDLWSLGCVAWEALTLSRLFAGDNDADTARQVMTVEIAPPSSVNPDVPEDFDPIVMRALERDPARRYSTAKAIALDLEAVLRKHGYSGKNTRVAQYMQATFARHVAVRSRLRAALEQGSASVAVLDAAFPMAPKAIEAPVITAAAVPVVRPTRPTPRRRLQAPRYAVAVAVAVMVVVVLGLATRRDIPSEQDTRAASPAPDAAITRDATERQAAILDAAVMTEPETEPEPVVEPPEIEMPGFPPRRPTRPPPPVRVGSTAEQLYAAGLDAFRRGESKAALGLLEQARQVNANHAPTWYALGLVHETLGNRSAAKAEYLRYLSLAPRAANAQQVRDRLNAL